MFIRYGVNRVSHAFIGLVFVATLLCGNIVCAKMTPQSLDELTANSSHVLRGRVLTVESKWNEDETTIFTEISVQITETYKSTDAAPKITKLIVPGGIVGDTKLWVEHTPTFKVGEDVVTFLIDRGAYYDVTSWVQGKYTVENETVSELGSTSKQFIGQINEVISAERKRNGEK